MELPSLHPPPPLNSWEIVSGHPPLNRAVFFQRLTALTAPGYRSLYSCTHSSDGGDSADPAVWSGVSRMKGREVTDRAERCQTKRRYLCSVHSLRRRLARLSWLGRSVRQGRVVRQQLLDQTLHRALLTRRGVRGTVSVIHPDTHAHKHTVEGERDCYRQLVKISDGRIKGSYS